MMPPPSWGLPGSVGGSKLPPQGQGAGHSVWLVLSLMGSSPVLLLTRRDGAELRDTQPAPVAQLWA